MLKIHIDKKTFLYITRVVETPNPPLSTFMTPTNKHLNFLQLKILTTPLYKIGINGLANIEVYWS